jgi:alpha-mannosidase
MIVPAEQAALVRNFHEHGWSDWSLTPYGHGNGGGGPTREMVERARRMADLDGLPRTELGTVGGFFEAVEAEAASGAPVPVWHGELYFEMHRGTLTSQVRTKVGNRRNERLLHEAELWWTMLGWPDDVASELDGLWKDLLVQQFHDILPGSSIAWVHAEAEAEHARITERLEMLIRAALDCLAPGPVAVASARSRSRAEVVEAPLDLLAAPPGGGPVQQLAGSDGRVAFLTEVPALGITRGEALPLPAGREVVLSERSLSNGRLAVEWDDDGALVSVRSLEHGRELLEPGRRIELELTPDHPVEYDAWDLEGWTRRRSRRLRGPATVEVLERGPLLGAVRVSRADGPSTFAVTYRVTAGSGRLDLVVDADWHHEEHLLSMAFPIDVRAEQATCDIQFGHVRRPTHASSSWDAAKFEVCAHRFVDLSEPSFGVAVLNDGRYGHALQGDAVRVSLLRAARYPDPQADRGHHSVTLALLPHGRGLESVLEEAEALNRPPRVIAGGSASKPAGPPFVTVLDGTVEVVALKGADDGSGDIVVRLHEPLGDRGRVRLGFAGRVQRVARCSLLEDPGDELVVDATAVELELRPFELVTPRVSLASRS